MAVIKCKNCENEILDTEIVCPYCDSPVEIESEDESTKKSVGAAMSGETVKIATSKDFEKEKEAFLKSIDAYDEVTKKSRAVKDDASNEGTKSTIKETSHGGSVSKTQVTKVSPRTAYYQKLAKRKKQRAMILTVVVGVIVIVGLIVLISNLFGSDNKGDSVSEPTVSSAGNGFEYKDGVLTIMSADCLKDYVASDYQEGKMPWSSIIKDNKINEVVIKNGIVSIGEYAFSGMEITKVTVPASVATIKGSAFYGCPNLKTVNFASNLTELNILGNAFFNCGNLEKIVFPENVKEIHLKAFANCAKLETVLVLGENTNIQESAFDNCSDDLIIYCVENSLAHKFAESSNIKVRFIDNDGNVLDTQDEEDDEEKESDGNEAESDDDMTDPSEDTDNSVDNSNTNDNTDNNANTTSGADANANAGTTPPNTDANANAGTTPGTDANANAGTTPGTDANANAGTTPGTDANANPDTTPGTDANANAGTTPGTDANANANANAGTTPGTDTNTNTSSGNQNGNSTGTTSDAAQLQALYDKVDNAQTPEEEAAIWAEINKIIASKKE